MIWPQRGHRNVSRTWFSAALEHHREPFWLLSHSPSTPQTSGTAPQSVACRRFLMILRWWSLQNWSTWGKPWSWWWISCRHQHSLHPGDGHQEDQLLQAPTVCLHLNNKLDWSENKNTPSKKWYSRLLLLRIPRSFGILEHFWSAIPEKSTGEAISLPGTKRGWERLC